VGVATQNKYVFRTLKWSPEDDKLVEIPKNDTHEENDEQQAQKVISLYFLAFICWLTIV
jgi:hypothetical protein